MIEYAQVPWPLWLAYAALVAVIVRLLVRRLWR